MAGQGRKRLPTALHKLHGNPSEKKIDIREPVPSGVLDGPPGWFNEEQRASWHYALDNAPGGLLRRLDKAMLTIWVMAETTHRDAAQKLMASGLLVNIPGVSVPQQSPFLSIMNKQAFIMVRVASEMGFSPASRARVYQAASAPPTIPGERSRGSAKQRQVSLDDYLANAPPNPVLN